MNSLGDILTAMVTALNEDGSVNYEGTAELAEYLIGHGSDGLVVSGTTGESPTLTDEEKLELFRVVVDAAAGRATVIAGTGSNDTAHSVELTRRAGEIGVDGVLAVTPYYNKPPAAGVIAHFQAVAAAAELPVILYNIPGRTALNVEPETLAVLSETPNIVAVKQANPDLEQTRRLTELCDMGIYAGNDDMVYPLLEYGSWGGICVASHLAGPEMKQMVELFRAGSREEAAAIDQSLAPLYEAIFIATNPIPIKAALNMMGHAVGGLRLPLVPATEAEAARIREVLQARTLIG
ncbi:MAG: 4-hydroxy-tetrahydrodipicolinate synthase [Thermoleophilia bacterium]|jgi:4-hydroxy-tetrahydrodipicolinate synthase|nr:4-hydroxy-tetrahydrodipicolinate synthase [Actinomycetota bacterium]MCL6093711.1 4-hydroxy-tetrahydrodipicolinate synthase [Actinomycetota bacterium]MDA8167894.1 4-hydroxy-tetrahydrodipicolinate synthase [Actinomycetota bacterium]